MTARRPISSIALCLLLTRAAGAQAPDEPTRASTIAAAQEEKAKVAAPYVPNRAERMFQRFEERGFPLLGTPRGFYPALGSVFPGGGVGLGVGFREFAGETGLVDLHALYSLATYKRAEITYRATGFLRGKVDIDARGGWLDAPRVSFFGLGPDTAHDDRTVFRLREAYGEFGATWKPVKRVAVRGQAAYESYDQGSGTGRAPSIETRFTPATAPGLGDDAAFLHTTASASLFWLASPGYSRTGGLARWTYDSYSRIDEDGSFGVNRVEVVQHLPVLRETWVASLRARADAAVGEDVPFFLLPSLGSGSTLRAFSTGRFRDRKSLLLTGEWRWIPSRLAIDMALFADAGTVGREWSDLTANRLTTDYGIGIRFHAPAATALRIDMAHGREGWHLVFTSGAAF